MDSFVADQQEASAKMMRMLGIYAIATTGTTDLHANQTNAQS